MRRLTLSINEIAEKDFGVELKGYNPLEVDKFLDTIASDYEAVKMIFEEYEKRIEKDQLDINNLLNQKRALENKIEIFEEQIKEMKEKGFDSLVIVERLGKIEDAILELRKQKK